VAKGWDSLDGSQLVNKERMEGSLLEHYHERRVGFSGWLPLREGWDSWVAPNERRVGFSGWLPMREGWDSLGGSQ